MKNEFELLSKFFYYMLGHIHIIYKTFKAFKKKTLPILENLHKNFFEN